MRPANVNILVCLLLMLVTPGRVVAEQATQITQVKYIGNNSAIREDYYIALIDAALKATENDYGAYQITYLQEPLASERKHELLVSGEKLNIDRLVGFPTDDGPRKGLLRVDIPILNGFMGYRALLIRAENQTRFSAISKLDELLELPMGFGKGWEGDVYKHNGFTVAETTNVDMMLKMLAGKRYAFIPLSVIEIEDNYEIEGVRVDALVPEKTLLIYMPLPVYFYVSPTEPILAERLTKGLRTLKASGEIDNIFMAHFSERLRRLNLSRRNIIELTNPDNDGSIGVPDHRVLQRF